MVVITSDCVTYPSVSKFVTRIHLFGFASYIMMTKNFINNLAELVLVSVVKAANIADHLFDFDEKRLTAVERCLLRLDHQGGILRLLRALNEVTLELRDYCQLAI